MTFAPVPHPGAHGNADAVAAGNLHPPSDCAGTEGEVKKWIDRPVVEPLALYAGIITWAPGRKAGRPGLCRRLPRAGKRFQPIRCIGQFPPRIRLANASRALTWPATLAS
jgi:hypothetical protein